jgi:predicted Zn-dependent peptidase
MTYSTKKETKQTKKNTHKCTHKKVWKKEFSKKTKICIEKINGYKVLFIENESRTLSVQSFIFRGFIHETLSNLGVNHLLEHVLSNAYKKCKNFNCYKYWSNIGVIGNAITSNNILNYFVNGLEEDTNKMLDFIVKITCEPEFNEALVEKEKQAVHNELLINIDKPDTLLFNQINQEFFTLEGLKYMQDGQIQIDNLKKFNKKYLMNYYKDNYNSENTLFVVCGKFDKRTIRKLLEKRLTEPDSKIRECSRKCNDKEKLSYRKLNCFTYNKDFIYIQNPKLKSTRIIIYFPTHFSINSPELIELLFTISIMQRILFEYLRTKYDLIYNLEIKAQTNVCGTIVYILINTKNENFTRVMKYLKEIIEDFKHKEIQEKYIKAHKKIFSIKDFDKKYTSQTLAQLFGVQYIYKEFLNTRILTPDELKRKVLKIRAPDIKKIISKTFDFNKSVGAYSGALTNL